MDKTVNQATNQTGNQAQDAGAGQGTGAQNATGANAAGTKTFTQTEVDAIISDRLSRERKKYGDVDIEDLLAKAKRLDELEEASKSDLQKANELAESYKAQLEAIKKEGKVREAREQAAKETGVPVDLLTADTVEDCKKQAEAIKAFANPGYPSVKDGGEAGAGGGTTTREMFANWADKNL